MTDEKAITNPDGFVGKTPPTSRLAAVCIAHRTIRPEDTMSASFAVPRRRRLSYSALAAASLAAYALLPAVRSYALDITVNCDGIDIGTISVNPVAHAGGTDGISATFTSDVGSTADAAALCGDDHFNWYQVVTADNMPPKDKGGNTLTPPYVDPPPGGYQYQQPAGDDYLPWYWSETPLGGAATSEVTDHTDEAAGTATFSDNPGGAAGTDLSFSTYLVSVNKDGSFHEFEGGFSWDWSNSGGSNGTSNIQELPEDPPVSQYEDIIGGFDNANEESYWTGLQGLDWFNPNNWTGNAVPAANAYTCLTVAGGSAVYDPSTPVPLKELIADGSGTGFNLSLQSNITLSAELEKIGYHNSGTFTQNNGTNQAVDLYLGYYPGSSGQYMLSNGSLHVSDSEIIGVTGAGMFVETGGMNQVNGALIIGGAHGTGSYNLQGGQLIAASTQNNGQITLGTGLALANLGAVSGTGTISVGGFSGPFAILNASALQQTSMTINPTGRVAVFGGTDNQLNSLQIVGSGALDLTNTHLFINYGAGPDPITSIAGYLHSGYNGGAWNGTGIQSSTAAGTASYALGYADSADPGNPAGLPSGTIEIAYTLQGDTNLDYVVNGVDFGIVAANFNHTVLRWDRGDFNYDNIVNGVDFAELAANFNKGADGAAVGPSALSDPALVAFAQANGLMADIPEPVSAAALALLGAGMLARRRPRF
jgi:hypothetical protein